MPATTTDGDASLEEIWCLFRERTVYDRGCSSWLTEYQDPVRVTSEVSDVILGPDQRRFGVPQAPVTRRHLVTWR